MAQAHPEERPEQPQDAGATTPPKENFEMVQDVQLQFDDDLPQAPGPMLGFAAGVLLSIVLWLLVGCAVLVVHLLNGPR